MIPRFSFELNSELPSEHTGWTPKKDDVSEEGFGGYRGTWLIRGVGVREARRLIAIEQSLVELAGRLSADPDEFEGVASALESGESDTLPERLMEGGALAELEPYLGDGSPVDGLELGVAGLVYALAAAGCWTASSCRGHPGEHAWSPRPVVFLTCDTYRANILQPLVESASCGFCVDVCRPNLLGLEAESVVELMNLAQLVIDTRRTFVPKRSPRRPRTEGSDSQGRFVFDDLNPTA